MGAVRSERRERKRGDEVISRLTWCFANRLSVLYRLTGCITTTHIKHIIFCIRP